MSSKGVGATTRAPYDIGISVCFQECVVRSTPRQLIKTHTPQIENSFFRFFAPMKGRISISLDRTFVRFTFECHRDWAYRVHERVGDLPFVGQIASLVAGWDLPFGNLLD